MQYLAVRHVHERVSSDRQTDKILLGTAIPIQIERNLIITGRYVFFRAVDYNPGMLS